MTYYIFCGILSVTLISLQSFCGVMLITPRDVGGTLFGGMFFDLIFLGGWLLVTAGLILLIFMRFAGARLALLCSSAIQMVAGIISLFNYPDDANGELIFSPTQGDIHWMIALIGTLLLVSAYIIKRGCLRPEGVE